MKLYMPDSALCQNMILLHRRSRLSYEDFAEKIGISKSSLQRIEAGLDNINLKTLSTIAEGLHLHPALLLTDLPQRMEEPVHQAIVGLYLLYSPLPLEEKKEFWGILHSLEAADGCRPE